MCIYCNHLELRRLITTACLLASVAYSEYIWGNFFNDFKAIICIRLDNLGSIRISTVDFFLSRFSFVTLLGQMLLAL